MYNISEFQQFKLNIKKEENEKAKDDNSLI